MIQKNELELRGEFTLGWSSHETLHERGKISLGLEG